MFTSHKQISPPSLVLKLKISEVSQKWIPKAVELKRIPTHKKCKCKKFCSQTRLVGEIYSSDVIMHRGYWRIRLKFAYWCRIRIAWHRCCDSKKILHDPTNENFSVVLTLSTRKRIGNRLRWPEPIYMRVGYVSESRFLAGMIYLISMIFGILNKEWSNFKKMLFIFLMGKKTFEISAYV